MKKNVMRIMIGVMFLAGLSLLLYPLVSNEWNTYRQERLISSYDIALSEKEEEGTVDFTEEWNEAESYNEALLPSILPDSFAVAEAAEGEDEEYMSCLNLNGDGMMGYVEVPKIDIRIPVFHTTEEDVLQTAAGHLEGSSLPVGGESTHSVISAHRGLPSATLFTDLDKLEEGDHFLLYILDDVLCYEVDMISVVEPEETDSLAVEEGEDLVTLLTCTPYGVNSQRLLVRGHRVPYEETELEKTPTSLLTGTSLHTSYLLWVIVGISVTAVFILFLYLYERRMRQKRESHKEENTEQIAEENTEQNIDQTKEE